MTIVTFQNKDAGGGDYFVGFVTLIIALGFVVAAVADFFMLTKVNKNYLYILLDFK